jgi:CRP/FNR family cyclic AMP-dependent transcriptional regulator
LQRDEIISILRSVSLFVETPADILAEIADRVEVVEVAAGAVVFQKGDPGDSLFIVAQGRLHAHDGERVLNDLVKREVFGEMAALDPAPRSASITAEEDSLLLRLDQHSLFELMNHHAEVMRGVIHILSQRLRARMRDMADDFQYIRQFQQVTAVAAAVEAGIYEPESLNEAAQRADDLGTLARVFQRSIREVQAREQSLQQQVADLRIKIDQVKQARQVAEITDSDYFQTLRRKTGELRAARHSDRPEENQ